MRVHAAQAVRHRPDEMRCGNRRRATSEPNRDRRRNRSGVANEEVRHPSDVPEGLGVLHGKTATTKVPHGATALARPNHPGKRVLTRPGTDRQHERQRQCHAQQPASNPLDERIARLHTRPRQVELFPERFSRRAVQGYGGPLSVFAFRKVPPTSKTLGMPV
jgi:hypothetical protein